MKYYLQGKVRKILLPCETDLRTVGKIKRVRIKIDINTEEKPILREKIINRKNR